MTFEDYKRHLVAPSDPRNNPNHRERGPKRFTFTYADIARAAGVTVGSVKNAASEGRVDPAQLESVLAYVTANRPKGDRP